MKRTLAVVALVAAALQGVAIASDDRPMSVVVTTSMLEEAVRELGEAAAGVEIVRLLPPGSCPGHFDLSPRAVPALRAARLIVRHAYQGVLEAKLHDAGVTDATVVVADANGSPMIPDNFAVLVDRVAGILTELEPSRAEPLADAAASVRRRLDWLNEETAARSRPWRGAPAIASFQQAEFCRWLGLEVMAEIGRPEDTTPRDLERLLQLEPALVVGNLQEGVESAATVAGRLGVPLAVLSNFPGADGYGTGFDQLLFHNIERLDQAWAAR